MKVALPAVLEPVTVMDAQHVMMVLVNFVRLVQLGGLGLFVKQVYRHIKARKS